jgi:hypothetical protein
VTPTDLPHLRRYKLVYLLITPSTYPPKPNRSRQPAGGQKIFRRPATNPEPVGHLIKC